MRPAFPLSLLLAAVVTVGCSAGPTETSEPTAPSPETTASEPETAAAETTTAAAETPAAETAETVVYAADGVAIAGADPVAYFTDAAYVPGSAEFSHEWSGATWHFASAENRDAFTSDPEAYAPEYGGHCAWAVSQGYKAPIDPTAWKVVDGKLYLNYDARIQARWAEDISGNIAKADQNWPSVSKAE